MAEMVRINTRISATANEWLDNESKITGLPKSTIVMMAIDNFIREKEAFVRMADMGEIVAKLEQLEKTIEGK